MRETKDYRARENARFKKVYEEKGEVTLDTKTGRRLLFICGADVPLPESPRHGDRWGDWEYNAKWLTLTWQPKGRAYEIDLEQCNNSAQVLDWVAQITHKTWATSEVVGTLVQALDDLLNLQGSVCGSGIDKKVDHAPWLRARHRAHLDTRRAIKITAAEQAAA